MEKEKDVSRGRKQNGSGTRQQGAERRKAENTTDKNKRTSRQHITTKLSDWCKQRIIQKAVKTREKKRIVKEVKKYNNNNNNIIVAENPAEKVKDGQGAIHRRNTEVHDEDGEEVPAELLLATEQRKFAKYRGWERNWKRVDRKGKMGSKRRGEKRERGAGSQIGQMGGRARSQAEQSGEGKERKRRDKKSQREGRGSRDRERGGRNKELGQQRGTEPATERKEMDR